MRFAPCLPLLVLLLLLDAAGAARAEDEVDAVLAGLASPVSATRLAALGRVVALDRLETRPRIQRALADRLTVETDPGVLPVLVLAVGEARVTSASPRLVALARAWPVPAVRAAALTALADIGGLEGRATALEVLRSPDMPDPTWTVRSAALLALSRCGRPQDVGEALVMFREGGGERHWFARAALAELVGARDPEPLPPLRMMVLDPDPRVALTAAVGLAKRGGLAEVEALLRHRSAPARASGASAVGRLRMAGAYPRLRSMAYGDRDLRVRWAASLALFRAEEPSGDELVLSALGADEPTIWAEAMAALTKRTGKQHGRDVRAWRQALGAWRRGGGR